MTSQTPENLDLDVVYGFMINGHLSYDNFSHIRDLVAGGQDLPEVLSQFQDPGSDTTLLDELMAQLED